MKKLVAIILLLNGWALGAQDFYDWNTIPEIKLYFDKPNWAEIMIKMKDAESDQRLSAAAVVNGVRYEEVGVRFKGNSSFKNTKRSGAKKLPFNIKLNYKNKDQKLPGGYETIKLSNVFRDPSYVREILSYEIARKYLPAPKSNFAKLFINDEYIGLYSNTESVDEQFLKKHFDENDGVFVKCDPEFGAHKKPVAGCKEGDKASMMYLGDNPLCYLADYEMKSDSGWASFVSLVKAVNQKPENLDKILHTDYTLWMHAFNNVLVNLDSYTGRLGHNYYMYQNKSGIFLPILWDMNLSFGGFRYDGVAAQALTNEEMQTLSPLIHFKNKNPKRPLIVNLLNNELMRKVYLAHMRTILEENFKNGWFQKRGEEVRQLITEEVKKEPHRLYSFESFQNNWTSSTDADGTSIIGVEELMTKRLEYLSNHPLLHAEPPAFDTVEHHKFGNTLAVMATLKGATRAWLVHRPKHKQAFQYLEMKDNGGSNDAQPNDGIWGATVEFKAGTEYYVIAENEKAAALSPTRASFEYHKVKE